MSYRGSQKGVCLGGLLKGRQFCRQFYLRAGGFVTVPPQKTAKSWGKSSYFLLIILFPLVHSLTVSVCLFAVGCLP